MAWKALFSDEAEREIGGLSDGGKKAIKVLIGNLQEDPHDPAYSKRLGDSRFWRASAGDYRVVFIPDKRAKVLKIVRLGKKRGPEFYRGLLDN